MKRKRLIRIGLGALACVAVGVGLYAHAAMNVPSGFGYSGLLRDGDGNLVTGAHTFAFDLLNGMGDAAGCSTDTRASMVQNGRFDVPNLFAGCASLDSVLATESGLAVKITVDGVALSPAQPLGAVPFAARARVAETVESLPAAVNYRASGTAGSPASGSIHAGPSVYVYSGKMYTVADTTLNVAASTYGVVYWNPTNGYRMVSVAGLAPQYPPLGSPDIAVAAYQTDAANNVTLYSTAWESPQPGALSSSGYRGNVTTSTAVQGLFNCASDYYVSCDLRAAPALSITNQLLELPATSDCAFNMRRVAFLIVDNTDSSAHPLTAQLAGDVSGSISIDGAAPTAMVQTPATTTVAVTPGYHSIGVLVATDVGGGNCTGTAQVVLPPQVQVIRGGQF
jgi:hypothetical protein